MVNNNNNTFISIPP